jgi:hypothetical protein
VLLVLQTLRLRKGPTTFTLVRAVMPTTAADLTLVVLSALPVTAAPVRYVNYRSVTSNMNLLRTRDTVEPHPTTAAPPTVCSTTVLPVMPTRPLLALPLATTLVP